MKKILLIMMVIAIAFACNNAKNEKPDHMVLNGKINGKFEGKVYYAKREAGKFINLDSVQVKAGTFSFTDTLVLPEMRYILFEEL